MKATSWKTKSTNCPQCKTRLDACTSFGGSTGPAKGDITICIECRAVLCFEEDGKLKIVSEEDMGKWRAEEKDAVSAHLKALSKLNRDPRSSR